MIKRWFDKVFDGNLLTHLTLLAINSYDIDFFVTCKETFKSKKHKCRLETKSFVNANGEIGGVTWNGFFYRDLLDHMKFKHYSKVNIVNIPHQEEISAIKTNRKVSKVECVPESHNLKEFPATEVRLFCETPKS